MGDHPLAISFASSAAASGAGVEAAVASAEAAYWSGLHANVVEELARVNWTGQPAELAAKAAIVHSSAVFWGLGDAIEADRILVRTANVVGEPHRQEVVAHHASLAFFSGRPVEAIRLGGAVFGAEALTPVARLRAMPAMVASWARWAIWPRLVRCTTLRCPMRCSKSTSYRSWPVS